MCRPFPFLRAMLAREYLDQKQSAEAFEEVAELVKEDTELPSLEAADTPEQTPKKVTAFEKYAEVYAQNSDLVGWISIPSTRIDYPVMQTKDSPDFYLKHAFDKSYSSYGVPYIQENCDIGLSDNLVLYGHHMNNGSMFSDLCKYESEDFYRSIRSSILTRWMALGSMRWSPPLRRWLIPRTASSITTLSMRRAPRLLMSILPSARRWPSMIRA